MRSRARVRRAVVAVAGSGTSAPADPRLGDLTPTELDSTVAVTTAHGLGSTMVPLLRRARLAVPASLEAHRFEAATRRARILGTLAAVAPVLDAAGVTWAVVKGPVTATAFSTPSSREFVDLDVLVAGPELGATIAALGDVGIEGMNRNWEAYIEHRVAEIPVVVAGSTIDLHWHLVGLGEVRRRFRIDVAGMLQRRRRVVLGGVEAWRLDPVDHLIHLAVHSGLSGATHVGQLRDVDATVRAEPSLDWQTLVARAHAYGVAALTGQVIDRAKRVLGTPVESPVVRRLVPAVALSVTATADRLPPFGDLSNKLYLGLPVAVARQGLVATAEATLDHGRDLAGRLMHRPPRWSAHDPEGVLWRDRPSGGDDGLERYVAMAATSW